MRKHLPTFTRVLWWILSLAAPAGAECQALSPPRHDYADIVAILEKLIEHEMTDKRLSALSIALVDDQEAVWSRGFGYANPRDSLPATAETVYRVGAVSELFTDIGVMQLVERGQIDLDAPVTRYLPDFRPRSPGGEPITLRQLMSQRGGLSREPPIGNSFEPGGSTLAATVESVDTTPVVYSPGTHTKYSNAAMATVGYVLERMRGEPFARYIRHAVLEPLGLRHAAFEPLPELRAGLATGQMWTMDGREFAAPTFDLGISPASGMYSTVADLARFLSVVFGGGRGVVDPKTVELMWTPQVPEPAERASSIGIGFVLSTLDGHRRVGHGGAIYGFATEIEALPDDRLGVAVITTADGANGLAAHIADEALRLMLASKEGRPLHAIPLTQSIPPERVRLLTGHYERRGGGEVDLVERQGELTVRDHDGRYRAVRALDDTLVIDDRLGFGPRVLPVGDRIVIVTDTFVRSEPPKPAPPPARWRGLIGEYGYDHDILYILERGGKLYAQIEWFYPYALEELSDSVFAFPKSGLYDGERLVFTRDKAGRATRVVAGNVRFERRRVGPEFGRQLRVTPRRSIEQVRKDALAATPPHESTTVRDLELLELTKLDPTIKVDIRYATPDNFLGTRFYAQARAFMQRPAAEAVVRVHHALHPYGYGLLIHDAYRPWYVTRMFWDATPDDKRMFVADPTQGSKHNRGAAVDLSLYDIRTGRPVEMVGTYDETTDRSYADYPGGSSLQRWHRELLRRAMEAEGFTVYPIEWWHFDYKNWRDYPILNIPFEKITVPRGPGLRPRPLVRSQGSTE